MTWRRTSTATWPSGVLWGQRTQGPTSPVDLPTTTTTTTFLPLPSTDPTYSWPTGSLTTVATILLLLPAPAAPPPPPLPHPPPLLPRHHPLLMMVMITPSVQQPLLSLWVKRQLLLGRRTSLEPPRLLEPLRPKRWLEAPSSRIHCLGLLRIPLPNVWPVCCRFG